AVLVRKLAVPGYRIALVAVCPGAHGGAVRAVSRTGAAAQPPLPVIAVLIHHSERIAAEGGGAPHRPPRRVILVGGAARTLHVRLKGDIPAPAVIDAPGAVPGLRIALRAVPVGVLIVRGQ